MTKTPPDRLGITFEVGAPLEARDSLKNWYAANIEKIDYEDEKVLVHYRQWSHRYDEWFDWSSPYLRPVERIQLRKQGLQEHGLGQVFHVNQRVLASWSDCRYYPAKVISCDKDDSYTVRFFDGVIKTVKGIKVKPYSKEGVNSRLGQQTRRRAPVKHSKPKENGKHHPDAESDSEKEDKKLIDECEKLQVGMVKDNMAVTKITQQDAQEEKPISKDLNTESFEDREAEEKENMGEQEVKVKEVNGDLEDTVELKAELQNGKHGDEDEEKEKDKEDNTSLCRKTRSKLADEKEAEQLSVPELRKRRASISQTPPSKRNRANGTDRSSRPQIRPARSDSVSEASTKEEPGQPSSSENPKPNGSSPDLATLLQRQVHLPTTNKYSREPLYRVIKNQPPPILSIELDHNPFKCQVPGCTKSFRKASLLHYHIKYYHSKSELGSTHAALMHTSEHQESHGHTMETPRRRRTISASLDTPSPLSDSKSSHTPSPPTANGVHRQRSSSHCERSKENLHANRGLHDDRDWVAMETERRREKRQRDFCIKQKKKKKKKKKSKSGEESCSDWSTDSPLWSEEELDDLNTPISEQGGDGVAHDSEIVRCVCEVQEENDFMIQCDECLCWQHGTCMGLYEDSVPDTYSCYICRDPPAQRQSQRYWYDKDWLSSGQMYGLSFLEENYSHQNGKKMAATHQLLGDVHRVFEVLNGLQLKMSILQAQTHPDLKLWRQPWKSADGLFRKGTGLSGVTTPCPPSPHEESTEESTNSKPPVPPVCSFTSYISSEHCYQKPHTYYPALEQRLVVETRNTEELLEIETRKLQLTNAKELECRVKLLAAAERENSCVVQVKEEEQVSVSCNPKSDSELLLHQQWQLNLLEHIEAMQEEVSHRMDLIERELDVLESWLDYTGELEPPEPLARLPQLKHRIRQLLTDLGTVQQIALCCSST